MNKKLLRLARPILIFLFSSTLLFAGFWFSGTKQVLLNLIAFPAWVVISIIVLFAMNLVIVSIRLSRILRHFGIFISNKIVSKASISGHYAGLFFASLFGQVVGRHHILKSFGVSALLIATLTAYERLVLILLSGSMCLFGILFLINTLDIIDFIRSSSLFEISIAITTALILSFLLGRSKFEVELLLKIKSNANFKKLAEITFITLIGQLLILAAFVLGALSIKPELNWYALLAASAVISFAASIPISVNGWGLREITAIYVMGQLGIPSSSALALSILIGLASTIVIIIAHLFTLINLNVNSENNSAKCEVTAKINKVDIHIEKSAAWIITTLATVLVFFQLHITVSGKLINISLADPFAILGFACLVAHFLAIREIPYWRIKNFNMLLIIFSFLLIFAFIRGAFVIGITQWAIAARVIGWLVLLGYLSLGYLITVYLGKQGLRRFAEILISTAVAVIAIHFAFRLIVSFGLIKWFSVPLNFEGYAGNRNAFAFQMLMCLIIIIAYSPLMRRASSISSKKYTALSARKVDISRIGMKRQVLIVMNAIILSGIVFSASRAGLICAGILLVFVWLKKMIDRKMLGISILLAAFICVSPHVIDYPNFSFVQPSEKASTIHGNFSNEQSNEERVKTITKGLELWKESPIIGIGLGVFISKSNLWFKDSIVIHSTPVWILVEFGLLGFGLIVWAFIFIIAQLYEQGLKQVEQRVVAMMLLVFCIFSLVHEIFYQRIFWLILGAFLAAPAKSHYISSTFSLIKK